MPNESPNGFIAKVYDPLNQEWRPLYKAPDATDSVKGDVLLSDAVNSTLNAATGMTAATPAAVKVANDNANSRIPNTAGSVTNNNLAPNSVTSDKIKDGTIVNNDIADGTITGSKIANSTITSNHIVDGTIQLGDLSTELQEAINNSGVDLTPNMAVITDSTGKKLATSAVTSTELGYLDGVTSNVQTQLNSKAPTNHTHNYAGSSTAGGVATNTYHFAINGTLTGNVNWNTYGASGVYLVNNATMTTAYNAPNGVYAFGFLVVYNNRIDAESGYQIHQTYITHNGLIYVRQSWDGGSTWNGWYKVYTERNKPTASEIGAASSSHTHNFNDITGGTVPISRGGTSGTTVNAARQNLSVMGVTLANGYYGMTEPGGGTTNYIRTPSNGIIPYQSGLSGSNIGKSDWIFSNSYIKTYRNPQPEIESDAVPSATTYYTVLSTTDKNNKNLGLIQVVKTNTSGGSKNSYRFGACRTVGGTEYYNLVDMFIDKSGNRSYTFSDPGSLRGSLGLGYTTGALPVANGGTGATAKKQAKTNLGIFTGTGAPTSVSGATAGDIYIKY